MQAFHPADYESGTAESRPRQTSHLLHSNRYETGFQRSLHVPSGNGPTTRSGCPWFRREQIRLTPSPTFPRLILPAGSRLGHRDRRHRPLLLRPWLHAFRVWVWSQYQNVDQCSPQLPPQTLYSRAMSEFDSKSTTTNDGRPSLFQSDWSEIPVKRDTNKDMTVPCVTTTTVLSG